MLIINVYGLTINVKLLVVQHINLNLHAHFILIHFISFKLFLVCGIQAKMFVFKHQMIIILLI